MQESKIWEPLPMRLSTKSGLVVVAIVTGSATAGPVFDEPPGGDAGNSLTTATNVSTSSGTGAVGVIKGQIKGGGGFVSGEGDYQDLFRIYIADPLQFSAETFWLDGDDPLHDPMLYLFNETGLGIMAMNNLNADNLNAKIINDDGHGNALFTGAGIYYLAITSAMSEATVLSGNEMVPLFEMGLLENQFGQITPNGEWAQSPLSGWTPATDTANIGRYEIGLQGVESMPVPAPAGLAVLGLAALGRRRRR